MCALRPVLMWLLLLALPLQGYAAATMLVCGPGHHAGEAIESEAGSHADQAAHRYDDEADATPGSEGHVDPHGGKLVKCSVCSVCCSASALPPPLPSFEAALPNATPSPAIAESGGDFLTDGPQRPPRTILV